MDCRVVLEAAVPVYDVETADEAIRIAIAKTGKMINPDLNYVEIEVGERTSPSGEELEPVFVAAGAALVALTFEMDVFNVDREKHASRIARTEIGDRLEDIPLEVLDIDVLEEESEASEPDADDERTSAETERSERGDDRDGAGDDETGTTPESADDAETPANHRSSHETDHDGDDVLPSFEELLDE